MWVLFHHLCPLVLILKLLFYNTNTISDFLTNFYRFGEHVLPIHTFLCGCHESEVKISLFFSFYLFHIKETLIVEMLIWCNKIVLFMLLFILGPLNTLYISFYVRVFTPCYMISSCKGFAHCWEPNMKLLIYLTFGCIWIVVNLGIITAYITFYIVYLTEWFSHCQVHFKTLLILGCISYIPFFLRNNYEKN